MRRIGYGLGEELHRSARRILTDAALQPSDQPLKLRSYQTDVSFDPDEYCYTKFVRFVAHGMVVYVIQQ